MPGYINSLKYVDDGRQKILEPHQQMLHQTLHSQVESRKVRVEQRNSCARRGCAALYLADKLISCVHSAGAERGGEG